MEDEKKFNPDDPHWYSWIRTPTGVRGQYLYKNTDTGEITNELPPILQENWDKRVMQGYGVVYVHKRTSKMSMEPPPIERNAAHDEGVRERSIEALQKRIDQLIRWNSR